ncbi:LAME_0E01552g1_1 [Lachancea meyersii CBS 8951]|uniref:LAME_0E01552g1_1 n=1 Tax=Lachancea meyersii CBS 8951 TaxID=1266667 RepID=A0A1G4JFJ9_9SACH|nr:LAME_0E01552g1_1 [Lachancea meyersii CBS 8951]
MKFGKDLESRQLALPEYNGHFIDYKGLKKLIKHLSGPPLPPTVEGAEMDQSNVYQVLQEHKASFFFKVERELEKVNGYYLEKEADLRVKFELLSSRYQDCVKRGKLSSKTTVAYKQLRDGAKKFERDLSHLEQFVELNRTGFSKVLKKWDKRSHSHTKDFYLATVVSVQPIFTRNEASDLNDQVSAVLLELNAISTQEDPLAYSALFASRSYPKLSDLGVTSSASRISSTNPLPVPNTGSMKTGFRAETLDISLDIETWYLEAQNIAKLKDEEPRVRLLRKCAAEKIPKFIEENVPRSRIDKDLILRDALTKVFLLLVSSSIDDDSLSVFLKAAAPHIDFSYAEEDEAVFSKRNILHEAASCEVHARKFVLQEAIEQCRDSILPQEVLRKLLNSQDANGRTPLHYACELEKKEFVELLINSLLLDTVDVVDNDSKTPLVLAVSRNCNEITELLLLNTHADSSSIVADSKKPQFNPLNVACAYKNYEAAKLILKLSNVDPTAVRDTQGRCSLHIVAKTGGDSRMIELLISHGADPNGVDGFNGWTPIFYAIQEGHRETVAELLGYGARLDVKDDDNLSPYFYALWEGHLSVINLLKDHLISNLATPDSITGLMRSTLEPVDVLSLEDSLHGIPDFALPPPIIPLRKYGHNFLERKIFVKISFLPGTSSIVLNKEDEMVLSSPGRVTLTSNISNIIPRNIVLPTKDDEENFVVFQVDSFDKFSIDFEIFPSFGTRMIAKTTALSTLFKKFQSSPLDKGNFVLPLFDARLKNVGELRLNYRLVFPYSGRPLEITKYETYWKSTSGNEPGKNGNQFITSSSLSGRYINFFVTTLNDGTLIVTPNKTITVGPMKLRLLDLNANQLESLVGYSLDGRGEASEPLTFELLLTERFTTLKSLLEKVPQNSNLEIEVCFPTECELKSIPLKLSTHININSYIDNILTSLFSHVRQRFHEGLTSSVVFTSRNPDVCSILNWKQPNFPVIFYMNGLRKENGVLVKDTPHHLSGLSLTPETVDFRDSCSRSVREVVQFAAYNNLLGVIVPLELLRASQQLIREIRARGLLLIGSFFEGDEGTAIDFVEDDINGLRARDFLDFKGSIEM